MPRKRANTSRRSAQNAVSSDTGELAFRIYRDHYARPAYEERMRRQRRNSVRALAALTVVGRTIRELDQEAVIADLAFIVPPAPGAGFVPLNDADRAAFRAQNRQASVAQYRPAMERGQFDANALTNRVWADVAFADLDEIRRNNAN